MSPLTVHDKSARPAGGRWLPRGRRLPSTEGPCQTTRQGLHEVARLWESWHEPQVLGIPASYVRMRVTAPLSELKLDQEGDGEQRLLGNQSTERLWGLAAPVMVTDFVPLKQFAQCPCPLQDLFPPTSQEENCSNLHYNCNLSSVPRLPLFIRFTPIAVVWLNQDLAPQTNRAHNLSTKEPFSQLWDMSGLVPEHSRGWDAPPRAAC